MSESADHHVAGLVVREHEHSVCVGDTDVPLTCREYEIIAMLAEHPGWVYSPGQLATECEDEYSEESVSVLVSRLRHKLALAGAPDVIQTVRGFGYRLRAPHDDTPLGDDHPEEIDRQLRDVAWRLHERIIDLERAGTDAEKRAAIRALAEAHESLSRLLG